MDSGTRVGAWILTHGLEHGLWYRGWNMDFDTGAGAWTLVQGPEHGF